LSSLVTFVTSKNSQDYPLSNAGSQYLFGEADKNIKFLEKLLNCQITFRRQTLTLKSENGKGFRIAHELLRHLIQMVERGDTVSERDIKEYHNIIKDNGSGHLEKQSISKGLLKPVRLKSKGQESYVQAVKENDITFAIGPAGTGKTYLAVALAVSALETKAINKIVLVRPAVEAGETLGFLPGSLRDKVDPYIKPLLDALSEMLPGDKIKAYFETEIIEIAPLAYMRGRTLNRAYIILDEAQNTTFIQMKMFLTRLGQDSKAIITGDLTQIDLQDKKFSGLVVCQKILKNIPGIAIMEMTTADVMRHPLVKAIIEAYQKYENKNGR